MIEETDIVVGLVFYYTGIHFSVSSNWWPPNGNELCKLVYSTITVDDILTVNSPNCLTL